MHYSKSYAQLLASLPAELQANAVEYRQLKKLIHAIVDELTSLGLSPNILHALVDFPGDTSTATRGEADVDLKVTSRRPKVIYELLINEDRIEPRLRIWVDAVTDDTVEPVSPPNVLETDSLPLTQEYQDPSHELSSHPTEVAKCSDVNCLDVLSHIGWDASTSGEVDIYPETLNPQEVVIPLVSDSAFFQMLSSALKSMSDHLLVAQFNFMNMLSELSANISLSARPMSSSPSFHPYRMTSTDPASISASSTALSRSPSGRSDLYVWRQLFQLYVEAEIFEATNESRRGERTIDDSEVRLKTFAERVDQQGLGYKLKVREGRDALKTFLALNIYILNLKKLQYATSEATRKILKKHTKRTSLPLPTPASIVSLGTRLEPDFMLIPKSLATLPHVLVQAMGETIMPIIPHVDDYACVICTSIAFKPIRLFCGHLFCVRCLVKMQKRGQGDCPMCRAPTVLKADKSNIDWAMLNFMRDWFPVETKEKAKQNETEAAKEQLVELGMHDRGCTIA